MKIALAVRTIRPKGGTESYLCDLVAGFKQAGHEVHVFTACSGRGSAIPALGATVHRVPLGPVPLSIVPLSIVPSLPRYWLVRAVLARTIRQKDYDLSISLARVRGLDLSICGGTHLGYLRAIGRRPRLKDRSEIALERRCYAESSLIVAHSRLMQSELEELYGVPAEKIALIHPPVDVRRFHPASPETKLRLKRQFGLAADRTTLLFPSTSHARKGLPLLLAALERLPAGRFELAVAGSSPGSLGGRDDKIVRPLGFVKNLEDVYRAADFTVLPSHYEPFGLVITESIACGTPVVTQRRVGACDLVSEREGVVFDDLTAAALAAAIDRASTTRFEIAADFCLSHDLTIERHIERLIAAGRRARQFTQEA